MKLTRRLALTVLILSGVVCADYFSAKAKAGVYYLESQEDSLDQSLFQYHALNASFQKSGAFAKVSGVYSDLYKTRGSEYTQDYRLSLAKAGYMISNKMLSGAVGRMYTTLVDRNVWWDGAELNYTAQGILQAHAFGGYAIPTQYEDDFMHTDSDFLTTGGSLIFTGIKNIAITGDYLKVGSEDAGTAGLGVKAAVCKKAGVSSAAVWDFENNLLTHGDVVADLTVRKSDKALLSYTYDDAELDTTRYFDVLIQPKRQLVQGGYYWNHNENLQVSANYGLLLYEETSAQLIRAQINGYGAYLSYAKEFESHTNMQEITAGYAREVISDLTFGMNTAYMTYELSERKSEHTALSAGVSLEYAVLKHLEAEVAYEFLKNREYSQDHRVFAGLTYTFFKGL